MFGDGRRGDLMLHVSKSRYATGLLDCSIATEHVLAIALQQGMQKKLLQNLLLHSGLEHVLAGNHYCFNLGPNASLCIPSRHVSIGHEAASQGGRVWPDLVVFLSRLAVPTAWSPQSCYQQDRPEKSAEDRHLRRTTRGGSRHPKSHMLPVPGRPPAEFSRTNNRTQLPCTLSRGPV
ncbi:hypothetical protein HDV62DRAFT_323613 [Trichoderma sp. SZMC 28011]